MEVEQFIDNCYEESCVKSVVVSYMPPNELRVNTRLPSNLRQTTRKCVHLVTPVTSGHTKYELLTSRLSKVMVRQTDAFAGGQKQLYELRH